MAERKRTRKAPNKRLERSLKRKLEARNASEAKESPMPSTKLLARHEVVDLLREQGICENAAWRLAIRMSQYQLDATTAEDIVKNVDQLVWDYMEFAGITYEDVIVKVAR